MLKSSGGMGRYRSRSQSPNRLATSDRVTFTSPGKARLAKEAIDNYAPRRIAVLRNISADTTRNALNFFRQIFSALVIQNLANELPALDAEPTERLVAAIIGIQRSPRITAT
ncbi:hypothetical protein [Burkholderia diffusa]|uniref:hypothetical protein n=1 Tax=Burkholderia diffusa TaxID=488732 RepID=UPI001E507353|nr:hypothetical protein [Burkholderia diffusa]